jgi:hypothetical protein
MMFLGMVRNCVGETGATGVGPGRFPVVDASRVSRQRPTEQARLVQRTFRWCHIIDIISLHFHSVRLL